MSQALAQLGETDVSAIEAVIAKGDLSALTAEERIDYYVNTCRSLGLNPMTKPFDFISLKGKVTLYATRGATDQLRDVRHVTITSLKREFENGLCMVTVEAALPDGRRDTATGIVALGHLQGEELANAIMKAETKAKRRVTLSICGLGWMDETEADTVAGAFSSRRFTDELVSAGVVDGEYASAGAQLPQQPERPGGQPRQEPSPRQVKYLWAILREKGWQDDEIDGALQDWFGAGSVAELTRREVSDFIERANSGPKWVDPRQRQMFDAEPIEGSFRDVEVVDEETGEIHSPEGEATSTEGVSQSTAVTSDADAELVAYAECRDRLEAARNAAEVNAAWKETIQRGLGGNSELYSLYERQLDEVRRG